MNNNKNILLVSHTFPPYPGIGGRRWAKFAKYLSNAGYRVHVITAENPFHEESLWKNDVISDPAIIIHSLRDSYPGYLIADPVTTWQKLCYRLSLLFVRLLSKGTPYDKAIFWNKKMLNRCRAVIRKENIQNVIVSCAPFSSAYAALALKKEFQKINLLVDFRDPWTWGTGYGMTSISPDRKAYERKMEMEVVKGCDRLFVPTEDMKQHLQSAYAGSANKVITLPHGYDADEIRRNAVTPSDDVRLILYGTLYDKIHTAFENIADCFSTNHRLKLDIFSESERYAEIFKKKNIFGRTVFFHRPELPTELFRKFADYDYVLIIQPDIAINYISTKIYEIIYSERPILLVSQPGKLSEFIVRNHLGVHTRPEEFHAIISLLFEKKGSFLQQPEFPIADYEYGNLTRKLERYFI